MGHLPKLIEDLALILITGALTTILFKWIRQPLVLGYIIAGFLVGPYLKVTPTVADLANVETLAEIGVIFLLFSLGLEFSFKKLMRVGGASSITAFTEIIFITTAGFIVGKWLGWSTMDSVFLGGMLASSSTTIIIKAFDELGVKHKQFANIVFGVLVVEDIVVIIMMVLLSTMAISQQFEGLELLFTVGKLLFFLALWFLMGIFLLPTFLKRARKLLDEETLLILSVGLCLGMVIVATNVGFSAELGAFIMGSIIAETTYAERIEHLTKPVKDLFGAVFFVSVGMMIDPQAIIEYGGPVIIITLLTIFGKLFSTTLGAVISGQPLKQSVQVGMSMAQIGEFAFIVATLGLSLGVISPFLFPVAVGASAITTFTTPYMIKLSEPLYNFLERRLPERWLRNLNRYASSTQKTQTQDSWKVMLKAYGANLLTNGIVVLALFLLTTNFLLPFVQLYIENSALSGIITLVVSMAVAAPFLAAFMMKRPGNLTYKQLWLDNKYNRGPLVMVEVLRIFLGIVIIGAWINTLLSTTVAIFIAIPAIIVTYFILAKRIQRFYQRIEGRFLFNLNARQLEAEEAEIVPNNVTFSSALSPWSAHLVTEDVSPYATYLGKTLEELAWREKFGINIAYIRRGDRVIPAPARYERLFPADQLGINATDEQLQVFRKEFETRDESVSTSTVNKSDIELQKILINKNTGLKGLSIRDSKIRERTDGLIIGIERGNHRMFNPASTVVFEKGDIVWLVGNRKKIAAITKAAAVMDSESHQPPVS